MLSTLIGIVLTFFSVSETIPQPEKPFTALEAPVIWDIPIEETNPIPPVLEATTTENTRLNAQNAPLNASSTQESVFASCVRFLREIKGIPLPVIAYARDLQPNITFSQIRKGDVIIFNYAPYGHIAEILEIQNNGVFIDQSNKKAGQRTQELIPYEHFPKYVIGFYRPTTVNASKRAF